MRRISVAVLFCCAAITTSLPALANDATEGLVGKQVTIKTEDAKLTDNVHDAKVPLALGENFEVLKVDGDRLETSLGWIQKSDVVQFDRAISYFSDEIQKAPTGKSYRARARVYGHRDEFEKAIA